MLQEEKAVPLNIKRVMEDSPEKKIQVKPLPKFKRTGLISGEVKGSSIPQLPSIGGGRLKSMSPRDKFVRSPHGGGGGGRLGYVNGGQSLE